MVFHEFMEIGIIYDRVYSRATRYIFLIMKYLLAMGLTSLYKDMDEIFEIIVVSSLTFLACSIPVIVIKALYKTASKPI